MFEPTFVSERIFVVLGSHVFHNAICLVPYSHSDINIISFNESALPWGQLGVKVNRQQAYHPVVNVVDCDFKWQ